MLLRAPLKDPRVLPSQASERSGEEARKILDLNGGNVPPTMALWCEEQICFLTGSDDMTLVHFLFSLQGDNEIETYLKMSLGDSHAVMSFAKEFSRRKRAVRATVELCDRQATGQSAKPAPVLTSPNDTYTSAKRKVSKKRGVAIDPCLLGYSVESSRIMQGEIQLVHGV